jgi:hypothetical protein
MYLQPRSITDSSAATLCPWVRSASSKVSRVQQPSNMGHLGGPLDSLEHNAEQESAGAQGSRVRWEAVLCEGYDGLEQVRPRQRPVPRVQQLQAP